MQNPNLDPHSKSNTTYEYKGETRTIIQPKSQEEFIKAVKMVRELQELIPDAMSAGEEALYEHMETKQADWIRTYVSENIKFDSNILQKNISSLVKKNGLKMSELEDALELSSGYISRTLNEGSNKRMSLDLAWKIAQLLNSDLNTMMTVDLQGKKELHGNNALVVDFIKKLTQKTFRAEVEWTDLPFSFLGPDKCLYECGMFIDHNNKPIYQKKGMPSPIRCWLDNDILKISKFINGIEDLYIIPYKYILPNGHEKREFELIAVKEAIPRSSEETIIEGWRTLFNYNYETNSAVSEASKELYEAAEEMIRDAKISATDKAFFEDFLNN